jgi:hypothetical protein
MRNSKQPSATNDDMAPDDCAPKPTGLSMIEAESSPRRAPSKAQQAWLRRGLNQPGGKLPLFDKHGQAVCPRLVRTCVERGWAEPWFSNPLKPDWLVCKLTETGRGIAD